MGNARVYLFTHPISRKVGYLPAVPVIKDYFRHERRKADNALMEFLTLSYLNGIAKYHPELVDVHDPATVREELKAHVFETLDTRDEPWRDNPDGLVLRKVNALAEFCVTPQHQSELDFILQMYDVEEDFTT